MPIGAGAAASAGELELGVPRLKAWRKSWLAVDRCFEPAAEACRSRALGTELKRGDGCWSALAPSAKAGIFLAFFFLSIKRSAARLKPGHAGVRPGLAR